MTSHALGPLPLSQTVTPSRTHSPLERDVLYGRPLKQATRCTVEWVDIDYCMTKNHDDDLPTNTTNQPTDWPISQSCKSCRWSSSVVYFPYSFCYSFSCYLPRIRRITSLQMRNFSLRIPFFCPIDVTLFTTGRLTVVLKHSNASYRRRREPTSRVIKSLGAVLAPERPVRWMSDHFLFHDSRHGGSVLFDEHAIR